MTNTPSPDALRLAAEWLRQYDDTHDGGEQTAQAAAVADWLDAQADAKELRDAAREHGVPVAALRKRLGGG
jgi:acetyl/propionyl-CoA carboxylase alpha subunit